MKKSNDDWVTEALPKPEPDKWTAYRDRKCSDQDIARRQHQANLHGAVTAMAKLAACMSDGNVSMAQIASAIAQEACAIEWRLVNLRRAGDLVNKLDKAEY